MSIAAWPSIEPANPAFGLLAGRVDQPRAHEQPEQHREHHDHQRTADELRGGELPTHQQSQDDAQLHHQVGRADLEGHRGGEVSAFAEQRTGQRHRGIRARRRRRTQPGRDGQGAGPVITQQGHDGRSAHDGLHHRRESEAQDQRPQDLPCHRTCQRQRMSYCVCHSTSQQNTPRGYSPSYDPRVVTALRTGPGVAAGAPKPT